MSASYIWQNMLPPWEVYPGSDPNWSGWREGYSEEWLVRVWLPFWKRLPNDEKQAYLQQWQPPTPEWRQFLILFSR